MIPEVVVLLIVLLMAPVRSQGDVFICVPCRPSDVSWGYGALTSSWISSARTPQGCPVEQKNPEKRRDSPPSFYPPAEIRQSRWARRNYVKNLSLFLIKRVHQQDECFPLFSVLCFVQTRACSLLVHSMQGCYSVKLDLSHHYKK